MATFGNINVAKNDITGKFIKSDPPTKLYSDNYDKILLKRLLQSGLNLSTLKLRLKMEIRLAISSF